MGVTQGYLSSLGNGEADKKPLINRGLVLPMISGKIALIGPAILKDPYFQSYL
jgi:hypothetical protein